MPFCLFLQPKTLHLVLEFESVSKELIDCYEPGSAESAAARSRHSETAAECMDDWSVSPPSAAVVVNASSSSAAESAARRAQTSSCSLVIAR